MPKVLIIGSENETYQRIFSENGLEYEFCNGDEAEIFAKGHDADAIVFSSTKFTDKTFSALPNLKIISRMGIGIDTVDINAASAHGVVVCNCANYGPADVAQHTIALLLSLIHSIPRYDRNIKTENNWSSGGIPNAVRLGEKSLGIVGFGRISQWICRVMRSFGMKIRVCDPYANRQAAEELGVEVTDLDTLLATSDILSLNAPLTADTYHMIGADLRENWLTSVPKGGTAIVVMEGVSMYLTGEERQKLLKALTDHFDRVSLLVDAYTVFAAKATKYKNPINDVGVTQVYGFDDPRELETGTGFSYVREHDMTPEAMIRSLSSWEQLLFRKLFAGKTARKFYRLYEYISR